MKRFFFAFVLLSILFGSCSYHKDSSTSSTNDSITIRVIDPEFFVYNKRDTIKNHSDLLWNFSLYEFGTGTNWEKWIEFNPVLQEPGRVWFDRTSKHWIVLVKYQEVFINPQPVHFIVPLNEITKYIEVPAKNSYLWWLLLIPFLLLIGVIIFLLKNKEKRTIVFNEMLRSHDVNLIKEIKELKNKLPVEAPPKVNNEWLIYNNPVSGPIVRRNVESFYQGINGKIPDLIIRARVSTQDNYVNMEFSHNRKAITGLDNVIVFIAWNYRELMEDWVEVGMYAGSCSNGFQRNPTAVTKGQLFNKVELVDENDHPICSINVDVTKEILYPPIVRKLVLQYQKKNIADIKKAGAKVEIPKA